MLEEDRTFPYFTFNFSLCLFTLPHAFSPRARQHDAAQLQGSSAKMAACWLQISFPCFFFFLPFASPSWDGLCDRAHTNAAAPTLGAVARRRDRRRHQTEVTVSSANPACPALLRMSHPPRWARWLDAETKGAATPATPRPNSGIATLPARTSMPTNL